MIAALQMYDWPEVQGRTDVFWSRVRKGLPEESPHDLSRPDNLHMPWRQSSLIVGQTCGLPYVLGIAGEAVIVGRPSYGLPMTDDGTYRSALICKRDGPDALEDFRGARVAINELISQSGCNALANEIVVSGCSKDGPFFGSALMTGKHRASAISVAEGEADIAAIDAVAWGLFQELNPDHAAVLKVFGWTAQTPALPFITSSQNAGKKDQILSALQNAANLTSSSEVGLPTSVSPAKDSDYQPIRDMVARTRGLRLASDTPVLFADI